MRHFKEHEFKCPCCGKVVIDSELAIRLDTAREYAGVPFRINSGYRCEKHNKEVGGSPTSSHLLGKAVDISAIDNKARFAVLGGLLHVGFNRIGIGKTFIHADTDNDKTSEIVWLY